MAAIGFDCIRLGQHSYLDLASAAVDSDSDSAGNHSDLQNFFESPKFFWTYKNYWTSKKVLDVQTINMAGNHSDLLHSDSVSIRLRTAL